MEDVVRVLGHLALGSRLKRLGERLQTQAQAIIEEQGMRISASHYPLLAALERLGPLSVGDIAVAIGISQPAVTRILKRLNAEGLVKSQRPGPDRRVRPVGLTRAGRQLLLRSQQQIWPRIEAAVADACAGPPAQLLANLAALEDALSVAPLQRRFPRGMKDAGRAVA